MKRMMNEFLIPEGAPKNLHKMRVCDLTEYFGVPKPMVHLNERNPLPIDNWFAGSIRFETQ